jgi:hypothetical protein
MTKGRDLGLSNINKNLVCQIKKKTMSLKYDNQNEHKQAIDI